MGIFRRETEGMPRVGNSCLGVHVVACQIRELSTLDKSAAKSTPPGGG